MRFLLLFALLLLSVSLTLPVYAQGSDEPLLPVIACGTLHYTALTPLVAWMGLPATWAKDFSSVKITTGKQSVTLYPGSVVALNTRGQRFCLAAPPVWHAAMLYVPTRPLVEILGGTLATQEGGGLLVTFQGRTLLLPPPAPAQGMTPLAQTALATDDPRLPVEALAKSTGFSAQMRPYMESFAKVAQPIQPALSGIANSQALRYASHIPVVGSLIGLCQDGVGAINGTIGLAQKMVDLDNECFAPIRDGFIAVRQVNAQPDAATIHAARPKWSAAVAAADKQLAFYLNSDKQVNGVLANLRRVDSTLVNARQTCPQVTQVLTLGPLMSATRELIVSIDAQRWQLVTIKEYFNALLTASALVQP